MVTAIGEISGKGVADSNSKLGNTAELLTPGPILLLGAPGAGKGTQARQLMAMLGVPQISTGDLLRANVAKKTELGVQAKTLMDRGELVPDDLVNAMVAWRLAEPDTARGYILDGYPRTLAQAHWLDQHLRELAQSGHEQETGDESTAAGKLPVIAVNIRVSYTCLLRRISGRRTCPVDQRIYNIYFEPPKVEGVCDVDGTPLVQRADDREEVVAERMKTYDRLTAPVIEHYRTQARFADVDGEQDVNKVLDDVVAALRRLRGAV
jgi:adenylate kinase